MDVLEVEVNHFTLERSHDLFKNLKLLLSTPTVWRQTSSEPWDSEVDDWVFGIVKQGLVVGGLSLTARLAVLDEMAVEDVNIFSQMGC